MNVQYGESVLDYNIDITTQDTEYSQALPDGVKAIEFKCRDATDIRHSFTTGKVATSTSPYQTLKSGSVYFKEHLYLNQHTLYVAAASGSKVVELRVWL